MSTDSYTNVVLHGLTSIQYYFFQIDAIFSTTKKLAMGNLLNAIHLNWLILQLLVLIDVVLTNSINEGKFKLARKCNIEYERGNKLKVDARCVIKHNYIMNQTERHIFLQHILYDNTTLRLQ